MAEAVRAGLVEVARVTANVSGKTEKMEILYQYVMSTGFRQRVEAIFEAFVKMRDDLQREKQFVEKSWAKREKLIENVQQNVSGMVGDFQRHRPRAAQDKAARTRSSPVVGRASGRMTLNSEREAPSGVGLPDYSR